MGTVLVGTDVVTLQIEATGTRKRKFLDVITTKVPDNGGDEGVLGTGSGPLTIALGTESPAHEFKLADIEAGNFIVDCYTGAMVHIADDADVERGFAIHGWQLVGL